MLTTSESFWKKCVRDPSHPGCRVWSGARVENGYGMARLDGKAVKAHRVAWTLSRGPIPAGAFVLHRCDVRPCCNPEHLFLGTAADNAADMVAKGRAPAGDRSSARRHPERLCRGDRHPARINPAKWARFATKSLPHVPGVLNGNAKLTDDQVREIRTLRAGGAQLKPLAARYGVSFGLIGHICARRSWKHVE